MKEKNLVSWKREGSVNAPSTHEAVYLFSDEFGKELSKLIKKHFDIDDVMELHVDTTLIKIKSLEKN